MGAWFSFLHIKEDEDEDKDKDKGINFFLKNKYNMMKIKKAMEIN